jgi:hypothetical protein
MVEQDELLANLKQFTGCDQLARLTPTILLTEGSRYLAEAAECFWLFDVYASHLGNVNSKEDSFTCLKITTSNQSAQVVIEDGNGVVLAQQAIEYTDFPLLEYKLYGCWAGDFWVLMLPSEY